jgi:hypothetical protein
MNDSTPEGPQPIPFDNDRAMRRVRATRAAAAELGRAEARGDSVIRRRLAPLALNMAEAALDAAGFDELLAAARLHEVATANNARLRAALEALVVAADRRVVDFDAFARATRNAREALR